ncbi:MAG: type II toxin-antitoxin system RelE/ParE family toxin [Gammaproteobacteria bacterium]|nr:type II toxin-antitoxin system RelE/ParE family toxin [Gammaproteobacteria bacterium]
MRPYVLTRSAATDLRDVVRYTLQTWERTQCQAYIAQIEERPPRELALGQGGYKNRDDLLPGLRVRRAGHHYLFCLPRDNQPSLMLAILHERMDMIARLQERLD